MTKFTGMGESGIYQLLFSGPGPSAVRSFETSFSNCPNKEH